MKCRQIKNAGYLLCLLPQITLYLGAIYGIPGLSVFFFFVGLPILRYFVGNDFSAPNNEPSALLKMYLRYIPRIYVASWIGLFVWIIWFLAISRMNLLGYVSFALSFWIVSSLNTAIAHELIHSNSELDRVLGRMLDATVGYIHFSEEHGIHHQRTGHYVGGDAATPGTSVYVYAFKRYFRTLHAAWEFETKRLKRIGASRFANRLIYAFTVPVCIAAGFYWFSGWTGLAIYLFQIVGAGFSVQAITYLQHWGLSERVTPELADYGFSWEDNCWIQACVTLNHAFHGHHHLRPHRPYYQLCSTPHSLTLPSGYPTMFIIALFPRLFSKLMQHRLDAWRRQYEQREFEMHGNDCIGMSRISSYFRK
jgi:alkane 1-monooxygenase